MALDACCKFFIVAAVLTPPSLGLAGWLAEGSAYFRLSRVLVGDSLATVNTLTGYDSGYGPASGPCTRMLTTIEWLSETSRESVPAVEVRAYFGWNEARLYAVSKQTFEGILYGEDLDSPIFDTYRLGQIVLSPAGEVTSFVFKYFTVQQGLYRAAAAISLVYGYIAFCILFCCACNAMVSFANDKCPQGCCTRDKCCRRARVLPRGAIAVFRDDLEIRH